MAETQGWQDETVQVAGTELVVTRGGSGPELIVLHEELGHPGITRWHEELARTHALVIPHHPGFGKSPRVEWINNARDMAGFYSQVLQEKSLAPANVIGFSLGGWIAAEMAASNASQFRRLVLVGAAGLRPPEGEIKDMFVVTARAYLDASVANMEKTPEFAKLYGGEQTPEQYEAWEDARSRDGAHRLAAIYVLPEPRPSAGRRKRSADPDRLGQRRCDCPAQRRPSV